MPLNEAGNELSGRYFFLGFCRRPYRWLLFFLSFLLSSFLPFFLFLSHLTRKQTQKQQQQQQQQSQATLLDSTRLDFRERTDGRTNEGRLHWNCRPITHSTVNKNSHRSVLRTCILFFSALYWLATLLDYSVALLFDIYIYIYLSGLNSHTPKYKYSHLL